MRKIKFRGMNAKGEWHHGNLAIITPDYMGRETGSYISNSVGMPFSYRVIPKTVGQFIGVKDINDIEIYEGDIILYFYEHNEEGENEYKSTIIFDYGCFMFKDKYFDIDFIHKEIVKIRDIQVIGNLYQNPELLEDK